MRKINEEVTKEVAKYATGARAGHRGFVRKSKKGKITFIPASGKAAKQREKEALERKLAKRRKGKKKGKKKGKEKGQKKKPETDRGEPEKKGVLQRKLDLLKAQHSLKRRFSG